MSKLITQLMLWLIHRLKNRAIRDCARLANHLKNIIRIHCFFSDTSLRLHFWVEMLHITETLPEELVDIRLTLERRHPNLPMEWLSFTTAELKNARLPADAQEVKWHESTNTGIPSIRNYTSTT